ncbi:hypothetical protein HZS_5323 [Henneguya salminicola]|nr:hypothetical protein HZS_5323 [Henneguya salminicola]
MTGEIDKANFQKNRIVDGTWKLGRYNREKKECVLIPVERQDSDTLISIMINNVTPGTNYPKYYVNITSLF